MENLDLTESHIIIGVELVEQFVELVANFDDETYLNDFYEDVDYSWDDEGDCETESSTITYDYRSDIVGYIGTLVIVDEQMATWTPHETFKFRLNNLLTK